MESNSLTDIYRRIKELQMKADEMADNLDKVIKEYELQDEINYEEVEKYFNEKYSCKEV